MLKRHAEVQEQEGDAKGGDGGVTPDVATTTGDARGVVDAAGAVRQEEQEGDAKEDDAGTIPGVATATVDAKGVADTAGAVRREKREGMPPEWDAAGATTGAEYIKWLATLALQEYAEARSKELH